MRRRAFAALTAIALVVGASALVADAGGPRSKRITAHPEGSRRLPDACEAPRNEPRQRIAAAKLIVEYNFTDGDIGVHGAFDDDGWKTICVFDPSGHPVLVVGPRGQLRDLAMAGIFFESREPPTSEFSFADLKAAFPEGRYAVRGRTYDGAFLVGKALFTHDVPAPPTITAPDLYAGPNGAERHPVSRNGLVVTWDPVTETTDGGPVDITGYEVIVTKEEHDDPHGFSRPIYDVHVPPGTTRLPVPTRFLEAGTVYELEVLALEVSGNQTISVGFFATDAA